MESTWRRALLQKAGCSQSEADRIITVLKRKFKPFANDSINQLFDGDEFSEHLGRYMRYGLPVAETWLRKQKIFSHLAPLDLTPPPIVAGVGPGSPPPTDTQKIRIMGHLLDGKRKRKMQKMVKKIALALATEVFEGEATPRQVEYFYQQLAFKLHERYNLDDADKTRAQEIFKAARDGAGVPDGVERELEVFKNEIAQSFKEPLSEESRKHLGVTVALEDKYSFSTQDSFCVWFSNNPKRAMPDRVKAVLEQRARANAPGVTKVVYSSACLNKKPNKEFTAWAQEHNIELVDIDTLQCGTETDIKLLQYAQAELKAMRERKGGNPAAASDLVRWISAVIGDKPTTYIDADMPMYTQGSPDYIVDKEVKAGHPVLLNMGSSLQKDDDRKTPNETLAFNSDIIAFTGACPDRTLVLEKIGQALVQNYDNTIEQIKESEHSAFQHLKGMPGFQALEAAHLDKTDEVFLPVLREALSAAHKNLSNYIQFIGLEGFAEKVGRPQDRLLFQEALEQGNTDVLNIALCTALVGDFEEAKAMPAQDLQKRVEGYLKKQLAIQYKPLVMEMSGPSAITTEVLKTHPQRDTPYTLLEGLEVTHSQLPRVLEDFACVNKKTNYTSDNIPGWRSAHEDTEALQAQREDGLSWMPSEQSQLAR